MAGQTLFLITPVTLHACGGKHHMDSQAANGLRLWLDNFDHVVLASPGVDIAETDSTMQAVDSLPGADRLTLVPLPHAPRAFAFFRTLPAAIRLSDEHIIEADYLCFSLWGLWGDWGSVATIRAARINRKAAVWTDSIASGIVAVHAERSRGVKQLYLKAMAALMWRYERHVIGKAHLGLFHGMDTFTGYAPYSRNPQLVHDIHLGEEYRISKAELQAKQQRDPSEPLRIIYAGRALEDKGIFDWIEVLAVLKKAGVAFTATWYGDGPMRVRAQERVAELGLDESVSLPGNEMDREKLMRAMRDADIFLFCHKIPESPRCLIEALLSGTPIVGYTSSYAEDLIRAHGGGELMNENVDGVASAVLSLAKDRALLATLQLNASLDGHQKTDAEVFRHRSEIIKSSL
jgi:colanic acid/amylovoran biosynthesis glycosyltransferase